MTRLFSILIAAIAITCLAVPAAAQATDTLKTATIKVGNLHCNNDMPTIKKRLLNQDGIDEVQFTEIAAEAAVFTIRYHSIAIQEAQIEKVIEATPGCDDPKETPYKVKKERSRKKKQL